MSNYNYVRMQEEIREAVDNENSDRIREYRGEITDFITTSKLTTFCNEIIMSMYSAGVIDERTFKAMTDSDDLDAASCDYCDAVELLIAQKMNEVFKDRAAHSIDEAA